MSDLKAVVFSCVFVALLLAASPAAAQTTALRFDSEAGDYIGAGQYTTWTPVQLTFGVQSASPSSVRLSATNFSGSSSVWWYLDFRAPEGTILSPGNYERAARASFAPAPLPGLDVSGSGRGCNVVSGRFVIYEIEFSGTTLTRFAADFEQHCEGARPALFGSIRYNSTRASLPPFDGQYPIYRLTIDAPENGYVTGTGIDCGAGRTDCEESFGAITSVTLTPVPSPGYVFLGWAGECSGAATSVIAVDRRRLCIPVFNSANGAGPDAPSYAAGAIFVDRPASTSQPRRLSVYPLSMAAITVTGSPTSTIRVSYDGMLGDNGRIEFAPAPNGVLTVGDYPYASVLASSSRLNAPGLSTTFCAHDAGQRFRIHELVLTGGTISAFAADFEHACAGSIVTGSIRYRSSVPSLLPFDGAYPLYSLSVRTSTGGRVTASGIDCGSDCEESYASPSTVSLTAVPDAGYEFLAWAGACGSQGATTVSVNVDRIRRCFAYFHPSAGSGGVPDPSFKNESIFIYQPDYSLGERLMFGQIDATFTVSSFGSREVTIHASRMGGGMTVSFEAPSSPGVPLAPGYYEEAYSSGNALYPRLSVGSCNGLTVGRFMIYEITFNASGQLLTLAADFEALCSSTVIPRVVGSVRIGASRSTIWPFDGAFPRYSLSITPAAHGTVTGPGLNCGPSQNDCEETYGDTSSIALTASPSPGYVFVGWRGRCDGGATTSVAVSFPTRCSAVFNASPAGSAPEDPALAAGALFIDSEAGDSVGQGRRHVWTSDAVIRPETFISSRGNVRLEVVEPNGRSWYLSFRAPSGSDLTVRAYEEALSPDSSSSYAGFRIYSQSYCSSPISSFRIHDISWTPAGSNYWTLTSFAADFVQYCNNSAAALRGSIRYRSTRATLIPFSGESATYSLRILRPSNGSIATTGIACGGAATDCFEDYGAATSVTLRAVAQPGYVFTGWTGACSGWSPTLTVSIQVAKACSATFAVSTPYRLQASISTSGLVNPVAFATHPTTGAFIVAEKDGLLRRTTGSSVDATPFLDIRSLVGSSGVDDGILGIAFPPNFAATRRFFVSYVNRSGHVVISRFRHLAESAVADPNTRFDFAWSNGLRHIPHPFNSGYAASLAFGADGYLYIGLSDGGADDPYHLAQSGNNLLGKILRVDVNVGDTDFAGFAVPLDNPFLDTGAFPEIWAFGVRRPRQISVDSTTAGGTGALILADRGHARWEEINYEPMGVGGRNYGWRNFEGSQERAAAEPLAYGPPTSPVFEYDHSSGPAITGGVVYRGSYFGAPYWGRYFFADYAAGRVWSLAVAPDLTSGEAQVGDLREHTADLGVSGGPGTIAAIALRGEEIYLLSQSTGRIIRVSSAFSGMPAWTAPPTADVNNDGRLDLVWHHATQGYIAAWLMNGTTLIDSVLTSPHSVTDTNWKIVATPRLNPDVKTDLVWQDDRDGWVGAWIMNGRELLESVSLTPNRVEDTNWKIVGSADLNRDGKADLVWRHQTEGWLAAWLMDGTRLLDSVSLSPNQVADPNWKIVGFGDFNRDGFDDILWWNAAEGWLVAWDMVGTRMVGSVSLVPERVADVAWMPVAIGDVNADGKPDIVWQHRTAGWIVAWLMNGRTLLTSIAFTPERVPDVNWRIVGPK